MPQPANPPAPLSREDWLHAALRALKAGGIDAVHITRLARDVGATRGSFYWHFEDRDALLTALLDTWRTRNTGVMLDVLTGEGTLDEGILDLFSVWVDHRQFDPALDEAIRDWARRDANVAALLHAEDAARVEAIATFLRRHGFAETEAFIRARVIYFTQLSYYALRIDDPMPVRESYLTAYFTAFTGRELDDAAAQAFLRKFRQMMGGGQ